jgi:hypothetical protein
MIAPDINLFPGIDPLPGLILSGFAVPEPKTLVLGGTSAIALRLLSGRRVRRRETA